MILRPPRSTRTDTLFPYTTLFRSFPDWFDRLSSGFGDKPPRIAMFCTGGIRCEKDTAFVKARGVEEVYHLEGGLLKYLETVPPEESRWEGECFVLDQMVPPGHGVATGSHALTPRCSMPASP